MRDDECVELLRWALPRLHLRWPGFRRVRRQVCRRIDARRRDLRLRDTAAYRAYLEEHEEEWALLEGLCRVTVSRFYRDCGVFEDLEPEVLPVLARAAAKRRQPLRAWSAGCASGEEPYTLVLVWSLGAARAFPDVRLEVVATDVDELLLDRARTGCYGASSLRELPEPYLEGGFTRRGDLFCLRPRFRNAVVLRRHDVRSAPPEGSFDLVLCRNLAFTYFDDALQVEAADRIGGALRGGGALVVGAHEELPEAVGGFAPWNGIAHVYRRRESRTGRGGLD